MLFAASASAIGAAVPSAVVLPSLRMLFVQGFHSSALSRIAVGDKIPSVEVHGKSPSDKVNVYELFKDHKRGILFHVPGAFTPGCSKSHLPGYTKRYQEFLDKGVTLIACLAVNDAFVTQAWSERYDDGGKIVVLADPAAEFVKKVDLAFDATNVLGGLRSKRCAMILENGILKYLAVEPDNTGLSTSLAENVLKHL